MRNSIFLFLLIALPQITLAQLQTRESIVVASGSFSGTTVQSTWSIGELFTESYSNSSIQVVPGINESGAVYVITAIEKVDDGYQLYPNPFSSSLILEVPKENIDNIFIQLFDITGKAIPLGISKQENQIVVSPGDIVTGVYIFKLSDKSKTQSYKIIKK